MSLEHSVLNNYGGVDNNNLLKIIDLQDLENPDYSWASSPYYCSNSVANVLKQNNHYFTILSLNCQSLNAKFDQLLIFLQQLENSGFEFSAICLQETWLNEDTDMSLYKIQNYSCISKGKYCSQHGGLVIYLHQNYNFEVLITEKSKDWGVYFSKFSIVLIIRLYI